MVIAFDFDGTLDEVELQTLALKFRKDGSEIWIVTMRSENDFNKKLLQPVLTKLFLSHKNVLYCKNKEKWQVLKAINADIYIDNINDEFEILKNNTTVIPLLWI